MLVVPYIPLRSIPVTLLPTLKNETIVNPIKTADTTKHLMSSLVFIFFICGVTILRRTMSICPVFLPLQWLLLKSLDIPPSKWCRRNDSRSLVAMPGLRNCCCRCSSQIGEMVGRHGFAAPLVTKSEYGIMIP